jgi:hypothetical protein
MNIFHLSLNQTGKFTNWISVAPTISEDCSDPFLNVVSGTCILAQIEFLGLYFTISHEKCDKSSPKSVMCKNGVCTHIKQFLVIVGFREIGGWVLT